MTNAKRNAVRNEVKNVVKNVVRNAVRRTRFHVTLAIVALALAWPIAAAADSPQQTFARSWEGKSVVLKQVLYTLVYNERGKLGNVRNGRRDGLVVVTPSNGAYFQFDGRQGKEDIVDKHPQRLVDAITAAYQPDSLDVRSYRKVEPVVVHRYSEGTELFISRIRVEKDAVRVALSQTALAAPDEEPATSFTIKWPVPFNKSFSERELIEALMLQLVAVKVPSER